MKVSKYDFYAIFSLDDCRKYFFTTKNHISKFKYNTIRNKKNSQIKTLLCSDNYEIEFIKSGFYSRTNALIELDELKRKSKSIIVSKNEIINDILSLEKNDVNSLIELDEKQKNISLAYGLDNENTIFNLLKHLISVNVKKSQFTFSHFDFYDDKYYFLIELKSLTYPLNKYPTSVMNTEKLIFNRMIFLFEYVNENNEKEIYYHFYDKNKKYKIDYIKAFNRIKSNEVIRIPNEQLKRLDYNLKLAIEKYTLANDDDIQNFNEIINEDKIKASFLERKY